MSLMLLFNKKFNLLFYMFFEYVDFLFELLKESRDLCIFIIRIVCLLRGKKKRLF